MQSGAVTVVVPVGQFLCGHAEGHSREERVSRVLTDEIVVSGVIHVGLTGGHGVENLERAYKLTCGFDLDGQRAVGHRVDAVGHTLGGVKHACQTAAPAGDHGQRLLALRIGRSGQCGACSSSRAADCRVFQKRTTIHIMYPPRYVGSPPLKAGGS